MRSHLPFVLQAQVTPLMCLMLLTPALFTTARAANQLQAFDSLNTADVRPFKLRNGKLAMSAYMLTGKEESENTWRTALRRMRAMGVQLVEIGQLSWFDLEPKSGQYKWSYAEKVLRINKEENLGLEFVADIMFINPGIDGKPKLPKHLHGKSFDDPQVIASLSNLYRAFLALPGAESVKYLFQHFENAEASFKGRLAQRPAVQQLLRKSFSAAKKIRPDIRIGVCIQSHVAPHYPEKMIKDWNVDIGTDVLPVISFGPLEWDPPGDPTRTKAEFEAILQHAHGKPIALHECGESSSTKAFSSHQKQAEFVRELFALLKEHHNHIELATWYEYCDLHSLAANFLGVYLGTLSGNVLLAPFWAANMGNCGLLTHDGQAKPGAVAWCEEAAQYYRYRAQGKAAVAAAVSQAPVHTTAVGATKPVSFWHPENWKVESNPDKDTLLKISGAFGQGAGEISLTNLRDEQISADQYSQLIEGLLRERLDHLQVVNAQNTIRGLHSNIMGRQTTMTFDNPATQALVQSFCFKVADTAYCLNMVSGGVDRKIAIDQFNRILNSLTVKL